MEQSSDNSLPETTPTTEYNSWSRPTASTLESTEGPLQERMDAAAVAECISPPLLGEEDEYLSSQEESNAVGAVAQEVVATTEAAGAKHDADNQADRRPESNTDRPGRTSDSSLGGASPPPHATSARLLPLIAVARFDPPHRWGLSPALLFTGVHV